MGGSCAIPLAVTTPPGVVVLTWAFTDFTHQPSAAPVCLLVLGAPAGERLCPGRLVEIRTHIRDLHLTVDERPSPLSGSEIATLAQAVIAALLPTNARRLAALLPLLAPGLDALAGEPGRMEITGPDGAGTLVATGLDFIPSHLLARLPGGYVHRPIEAVRVGTGGRTVMEMTAALSGSADGFDRAILIGSGRHAVAQRTGNA